MDTQIFNFRDVTAGYVIQSFLLSCISEELNGNGMLRRQLVNFIKNLKIWELIKKL